MVTPSAGSVVLVRWARHIRFGNRKTDALLLYVLFMVFPAFCPVPIGKSTFLDESVNSHPPWRIGVYHESACFTGYGITSTDVMIGPLSFTKSQWSQ